ncbi:MAG: hypothetical protein RMJ17_01470 [Candidatus Aenigmarchaeota archaeon]|nr:hypothetical protein [Candidatus Aenigmarchaeota archaeon]MDW8149249.1 hypothetical protein [Candidatus Aenigmarchaeota archaeon]
MGLLKTIIGLALILIGIFNFLNLNILYRIVLVILGGIIGGILTFLLAILIVIIIYFEILPF